MTPACHALLDAHLAALVAAYEIGAIGAGALVASALDALRAAGCL